MRNPTIGYLGAYAEGDKPHVPSLFRRGRRLHATDGRTVMGPFTNEIEARSAVTLALIKRHRRRQEWAFFTSCAAGICILCWLLAL